MAEFKMTLAFSAYSDAVKEVIESSQKVISSTLESDNTLCLSGLFLPITIKGASVKYSNCLDKNGVPIAADLELIAEL